MAHGSEPESVHRIEGKAVDCRGDALPEAQVDQAQSDVHELIFRVSADQAGQPAVGADKRDEPRAALLPRVLTNHAGDQRQDFSIAVWRLHAFDKPCVHDTTSF